MSKQQPTPRAWRTSIARHEQASLSHSCLDLASSVLPCNLQRAHDENPVFSDVPVLGVRDALHSARLKLIDPESGRMLTWHEARDLA